MRCKAHYTPVAIFVFYLSSISVAPTHAIFRRYMKRLSTRFNSKPTRGIPSDFRLWKYYLRGKTHNRFWLQCSRVCRCIYRNNIFFRRKINAILIRNIIDLEHVGDLQQNHIMIIGTVACNVHTYRVSQEYLLVAISIL